MRTRSRAAAGVLVLAALLAAACTSGDTPTSRRGPVSLEDMEAVESDSSSISVGVPSCNGGPVLDEIVEEPAVVRLRVVSTVTNPGDACLDSLEVELDEPLGDRDLVDMTSGAQIPVRSQP